MLPASTRTECYPLLDRGSKWSVVVKRSRELVEIQPDNMERVRQDVLFAWNKARVHRTDTTGPEQEDIEAPPNVLQ
jgi:hypothetical protein